MKAFILLMTVVLPCFAVGCGPAAPTGGSPRVTGLSKEAISVGETLHISGLGFLSPADGETRVEFSGVFYWTDVDGRPIAEDVPSFVIAPVFDGEYPKGGTVAGLDIPAGESVLRWNRFGPYVGPFGGNGRQVGIFKGTLTAINVRSDSGVEVRGEPADIALEIKPSVLITRLEPVLGANDDGGLRSADCGKPALRVFGGVPYVLEVETMGFSPAYFLYEIADINGSEQFTSFMHPAVAHVDRLGDPAFGAGEMVVFNQLPDDVDYALAALRVTAIDENDDAIATAMPVPVVRPVRMQYDGNRKLAEYYQPVPVHGPIVGSIGTEVTYAESTSESRQNAVSVTFTQSVSESAGSEAVKDWSEGYGISAETSETNATEASTSESATSSETYGTEYSTSAENSVQLGSETGTDWGWNVVEGSTQESYSDQMNHLYGTVSGSVETQVGGEASVPGLGGVSGHVGTTVGTAVEAGRENTTGERTGVSNERGSSMGTSENSSEVYGSTTTDGTSQNISGTYGVERQSSINTSRSQTEATNESLTYDMGGSVAVNAGYEVGSETAWEQSWVSTTEQENLLSFSGKIPNGRCAMIYRQTVRYVRTAQMFSYDMCGVRSSMGELAFNEWSWSPNIAIGDDCEANLPESTLPKAQCFDACE